MESQRRHRLSTLGLFGYNALYWPYLFASFAVLFVPALLLFCATAPFDSRKRLLGRYTSLWGAHYLAWAPFAGVSVVGRERTEGLGACIYVSNHQSMVDILAVFALHRPYLWVSKIENFFVPFLGWNMWLNGYVPLRRGYLPSIMRMVRKCLARLGQGYSLFVFPEGTRSPDGELGPFYAGAFRIATRRGVPIVPIVIDGTDRVLPKNSFLISPQPVVLEVLDPVHPDDVDRDWKKLHDLVRDRMLEAKRSLKAQAKGELAPSRSLEHVA